MDQLTPKINLLAKQLLISSKYVCYELENLIFIHLRLYLL